MKRNFILSFFALAALSFAALAAKHGVASSGRLWPTAPASIETDGTLDPTFDAGSFTNGWVSATTFQPDGKLLIGGQFAKVHGVMRRGMARLNADGTLDLSFNPGNTVTNGVKMFLLQSDGKIIVLDLAGLVFRLNSDGTLDNSFDLDRRVANEGGDDGNGRAVNPGQISTLVLQADGKIVVGGSFVAVITGPGTSVPRSCIARFNSDGTFDSSYNPGAGAAGGVEVFSPAVINAASQHLLLNNGKVVIQGNFDTFDGHAAPGLARLNTDGSFDSTFSPAGGVTDPVSVFGLFIQSDDQVLVFGAFASFNGTACNSIVRLSSVGVVDPTFSTAAFQEYGEIGRIAVVAQESTGKLIVGGYFHSLGGVSANNVVRLDATGARDASFGGAGAGPYGYHVSALAIRPSDGKVFLGGYFSTYNGTARANIAWANTDGSLDPTFSDLAGVTEYQPQIFALATQSDDKIIAGGLFSSFNGTTQYNLVRLNPDGTSDTSFNANV
jgi:uncharacterized delta-60 repeat protein